MPLFASREPWTMSDWWEAGRRDALNCIAKRYDGSDWSDDYCQQYIQGYWEGKAINDRTTPCIKLTPSESFNVTYFEEPGVFPVSWKPFITLIYIILVVLGIGGVIHGLARAFGG